MAEHPILILPHPHKEGPANLPPGRGSSLHRPTQEEQLARLEKRFQLIIDSFHHVQSGVEGLEIEQVLVFEVLGGAVERLAVACEKIDGLEWLVDLDAEDVAAGDGFSFEDEDKEVPRRLYAVMSTQDGIRALISLWRSWVSDPPKRVPQNFGPFREVFESLKDLRTWSVQDRLAETHAVEDWKDRLNHSNDPIRFEVELFWRNDERARAAAFDRLNALVADAEGRTLDQAQIPAIRYHGVLAELPANAMRDTVDAVLADSDTDLLRCEKVMFFRPVAQARFRHRDKDQETAISGEPAEPALPTGDPIVALLDGLPLENHVDLAGRLLIDDPDDFESGYSSAEQQEHGTAMASLIVHGDLSEANPPLSRPVYVRPVFLPKFEPFDGKSHEEVPDDRLLVDLIHRAVRRIVAADDPDGPAAPSVRVINLSIGNPWQPFDHSVSPLAKLLDWLAAEHNILFLVSAGNQPQRVLLEASPEDLPNLDKRELVALALEAFESDGVYRRLLSPADSVNALTVGAVHGDSSGVAPQYDHLVDLLPDNGLPSPMGTVSAGFNRSVKPEILFPGGRQIFSRHPLGENGKTRLDLYLGQRPPGTLTSSPGTRPIELNARHYTCGTSNSTALATRGAALIYERLLQLRAEPGGEALHDDMVAVLLKTLLVHGASWGIAADQIESAFDERITTAASSRQQRAIELKRRKARFLGYGEVDLDRCCFSTDTRVVMLGCDRIGAKEGHLFSIPLPRALDAEKTRRRLIVTLAWLSPINPRHPKYRKARVWFKPPQSPLGFDPAELDSQSSRRGTVQHQIYESEAARAFIEDAMLRIKVSCREAAENLSERVPYALAITLEVAEDIPIYEEIREVLRARVRAQAATE